MNNCYFPHDSNARNSKKLLRLRKAHGAEGYGTYFMLLERLREEQDFCCDADYEMLSYDLRVDADIIKSVIEDFGLFVFNDDSTKFYSAGFNERMDIKEQKSLAGKKGMEKRWGKKTENPLGITQNNTFITDGITEDECYDSVNNTPSDKEKKSKEKESKDNISLSLTPSLPVGEKDTDILSIFFFEKRWRGAQKEAERFVNFYKSNGMYGKLTPEQLAAKARLWEPKTDQRSYINARFSDSFIQFWRTVYEELLQKGASTRVLFDARSDTIEECPADPIEPDTYWLKIPDTVREFIEGNNGFDMGIIRRYVREELKLKSLKYR